MHYGKFWKRFIWSHLKKQQIGKPYVKNLKIFETFHIEYPKLSGTQYFNYKGFFSVVLLVICEEKYCFTNVDFGQYGSTDDSSVLRSFDLYKTFEENKFNVPAPTEAEGFEDPLPYFLLEEEIFWL